MPGARSVALGGALAAIVALRGRYLRWGATEAEAKMDLPGDEVMPRADLTATRAVTISSQRRFCLAVARPAGTGAGRVLQLRLPRKPCRLRHPQRGSHRARLAGDRGRGRGHARSAGRPRHSLGERRAITRPPRRDPDRKQPASVRLHMGVHAPRRALRNHSVAVRERYAYTRPWALLLVEPTEIVSFVMSQKMLAGIKDRVERTPSHRQEPSLARTK